MAGGTWQSQNKVRPGAYLNFTSVPSSLLTVGDRGIGIIPLPLSWGNPDALIEVLSTDMLTGAGLASVGFTAFDAESKVLNLMLQNCYKALVFRTNAGGTKAKATLGELEVTALYPGVFGNTIVIAIVAIDEDGTRFDVKTYVGGRLRNTQTIADLKDLVANDFVTFDGEGEPEEIAGEPLSGGTDGTTAAPSTWMDDFLDMASMANWQTMAIPFEEATISRNVAAFIEDQIEGQGRYVQAVLSNYAADYDGVINNRNGAIIDGVTITPSEFTAWVAGATAGASIVQSNTAKIVTGATEIIGEQNNEGIIQSLRRGEFVLSRTQDNLVKVEQDINSFVSFRQGKNEAFSKNRVVRTLHEIGTTVRGTWERSYMGQVNNDENGRAAFRSDLIDYLYELQRLEAIQEFAGANDVSVMQGQNLDAVLSELNIKPVDSMEKLYMNVNIRT